MKAEPGSYLFVYFLYLVDSGVEWFSVYMYQSALL